MRSFVRIFPCALWQGPSTCSVLQGLLLGGFSRKFFRAPFHKGPFAGLFPRSASHWLFPGPLLGFLPCLLSQGPFTCGLSQGQFLVGSSRGLLRAPYHKGHFARGLFRRSPLQRLLFVRYFAWAFSVHSSASHFLCCPLQGLFRKVSRVAANCLALLPELFHWRFFPCAFAGAFSVRSFAGAFAMCPVGGTSLGGFLRGRFRWGLFPTLYRRNFFVRSFRRIFHSCFPSSKSFFRALFRWGFSRAPFRRDLSVRSIAGFFPCGYSQGFFPCLLSQKLFPSVGSQWLFPCVLLHLIFPCGLSLGFFPALFRRGLLRAVYCKGSF